MARFAADDGGSSALRAALGVLLTQLRSAAVDGVVPERVFTESVRDLALGDAERERLRHELARLGLPVRELHVHTGGDRRDGEKVAQDCGESVFPRLSPVRHLLTRYADADGYVTSRVIDGVVRLAGLSAREAAQLRAETSVRAPEGEQAAGDGEEAGETDTSATAAGEAASDPEAAEADGPDLEEPSAGAVVQGDLAESVAAAHAVLDTDRRVRKPGSRLLSAQAEVGLTVLVRGGPDRIAEEPTEDELKALPPGDLRIRARDCLVLHNQRLVHALVRPHLEQGLDYEDLLQHGFLGLLRAARKFDCTRGFKFSTYATWWIRQSITRAIADEGALIRVPVHMHEQMRKVARAERALAAEGRRAGDADVAVRCDMTLQKVQEIRRLTHRTDSLDRVIGDGATLADFVGETHTLPPVEAQVVGALYVDDVLALVDTFTEREARILVRRLGLDGDEPSTLDELGREFGVTRERIRQIEGKARPALRARLREAGLIGIEAACEKAERAAERAAEAKRAARSARSAQAARSVRVRLTLRKVRAERLARLAGQQAEETGTVPVAEAEPGREATTDAHHDARAGAAVDVEDAADPGAAAHAEEDVNAGAAPAVVGTEAVPDVVAADWERACRMAEAPVDQLWWLADYARAALGDDGLAALLGQSAARVVTEARAVGHLPRAELTALEVLRRVFDALVTAGRRPEDFFDRPAEALVGATPRDYLQRRPLVNRESRLAVRDALREFLAGAPTGNRNADAHPPQRTRAVETEAPKPLRPEADTDTDTDTAAQVSGLVATDTPVEPPQTTADWDKALTLTEPPLGGGVPWLAEYALLALGHLQLSVLLGPAADAVVRAARHRGTLDRPLVQALETLGEVFAAVKQRGLRPEHFFESPAGVLAGATPRAYLATKPLVRAASRFAVRDALRDFVAASPAPIGPTAEGGSDDVGTPGTPTDGTRDENQTQAPTGPVREARPPVAPERLPAENPASAEDPASVRGSASAEDPASARGSASARGLAPTEGSAPDEARFASLAREHERLLNEERAAAQERVAAVRAEAERELDAWEEVLFARMDALLLRRERRIRAEAELRVAQLKAQHDAAYRSVLDRAQNAEEAARSAHEQRDRTGVLELRLRQYREGAEARIADLESRLSEAESSAAERERATGAWVAELETRVQTAEAAVTDRERAAASAREEYRQGAQLRIAELETRLRDAEDALAQRDAFVEAARRRAEEAEQQAVQRIAHSEHDARLRITSLQTQLDQAQAQLAAAQEAERSRGFLRDRWRRS
ncbi:sigma-70 family RNA polymerase sigma factor [Streptomyces sp. NPDC003470]|uniref:sigma-70 family RNA polymerase sigma factor n=1 Tax=Streptomyces sp. NPDC127100 TaxID=3347138 RepID=UPI003669E392